MKLNTILVIAERNSTRGGMPREVVEASNECTRNECVFLKPLEFSPKFVNQLLRDKLGLTEKKNSCQTITNLLDFPDQRVHCF